MPSSDTIRIDFICVHNAGRSQMAAAFAERECAKRDLETVVDIYSGGTHPADAVHEAVVEAMSEVGIDISDQTPKYISSLDYLKDSQYLVTMGCSISEFDPASYGVESRSWDLTNPEGKEMETVREVRDETESRVETLFDEIERIAEKRRVEKTPSAGVIASIRDALSF